MEFLDQAISSSMEEMYDAVREYESKITYHACEERGIRIWAGTGNRIMQAALWSKVDKAGAQPSNPRAIYKCVVNQIRDEIVWCEKCSVLESKTSGALFSLASSPRSLAEELDAMDIGEEDRERAESWRGGKRLENGKEAGVDPRSASETCGGSTETSEGNNDLMPSSDPVSQYHGDGNDESGVLLPNGYGCYVDSYGRCCCPRPPIIYL